MKRVNRKNLIETSILGIIILIFALSLTTPKTLQAEDLTGYAARLLPGNAHVKATLISDRISIQPNGNENVASARIGIFFEIEKGWHIYAKNSGEAGRPTSVKWNLPNGWNTGELQWPESTTIRERGDLTTFGFFDNVLLQSQLYSPKVIPTDNEIIEIGASVTWLACKDICVPGASELQTSIKFSTSEPLAPSENFQLFEPATALKPTLVPVNTGTSPSDNLSTGLLTAIFSAFIAGLILNLMPCVLPIISIKVVGFLKEAHTSRSQQLTSAFAFSAGILFAFFTLACVINSLRSVGQGIGWGFQFQEPVFVFVMMLVVFILSLGFFDIYTFRMPYMQESNRFVSRLTPSVLSHFLDGILATALSTPCTAPFLGTALAFAFTQSFLVTLTIFLSIGVGLAFPYVILSAFPVAVKLLPKPGEWMIRFRQLMGFSLLGTSIWLLYVIDRLTEEGSIWAIALSLLFYFCIWLGHWIHESRFRESLKGIAIVAVYLLFFAALYDRLPVISQKKTNRPNTAISNGLINWHSYSPELLKTSQQQGKSVFIDFTADWCITCQFNKHTSLETVSVAKAFSKYNTIPVKADWTLGSQKVTSALQQFGGQGVPHYVVIPATSGKKVAPIILPALLTPSIVIEALKNATSSPTQ